MRKFNCIICEVIGSLGLKTPQIQDEMKLEATDLIYN